MPVTTSTIEDDANALVPPGAILLWTGAACPTGYTRLSALDGKFLVADATYSATAGGSNTKDVSHTHGAGSYAGPSHTHGFTTGGTTLTQATQGAGTIVPAQHTHSGTTDPGGTGAVTGTSAIGGSAALDIRPTFATIVLCQKN